MYYSAFFSVNAGFSLFFGCVSLIEGSSLFSPVFPEIFLIWPARVIISFSLEPTPFSTRPAGVAPFESLFRLIFSASEQGPWPPPSLPPHRSTSLFLSGWFFDSPFGELPPLSVFGGCLPALFLDFLLLFTIFSRPTVVFISLFYPPLVVFESLSYNTALSPFLPVEKLVFPHTQIRRTEGPTPQISFSLPRLIAQGDFPTIVAPSFFPWISCSLCCKIDLERLSRAPWPSALPMCRVAPGAYCFFRDEGLGLRRFA